MGINNVRGELHYDTYLSSPKSDIDQLPACRLEDVVFLMPKAKAKIRRSQ
jgi:hypothetical protein